MDYLYGELDERGKEEVERLLKESPEMRAELEELKKTSNNLQEWKAPETELNMVFVQKQESLWERIKEWVKVPVFQSAGKTAYVFGAAAALFLLLSLANFEIKYDDQGFSMNMSIFGKKNAKIEDMMMIEEYMQNKQQETLNLISQMIDTNNRKTEGKYAASLNNTLRQVTEWRQLDMNMYDKALNNIYTRNEGRIIQTNKKLNDYMKLIGSGIPQNNNKRK